MPDHEPHGPQERHHHHDERPNLQASVSNLRGTGLPWLRVLAQVASNFRIKVVNRSNCCGNLGQPGC